MKTPREILLRKHQGVETKLDALREQFVAAVRARPAESAPQRGAGSVAPEGFGWGKLILLVRWHLAGLAAMWMLIAVLRVSGGSAETPTVAQHEVTLPRTVILALKQNRRQLLEFENTPIASASPSQPAAPPRRSHLRMDWAYS